MQDVSAMGEEISLGGMGVQDQKIAAFGSSYMGISVGAAAGCDLFRRAVNYQKRCWVKRLHQLSNTRSTEPLAAMPMRSCRLLRSA